MAIVVPPGALESHITEPWSFRTGIRLGEHLVQQLKLCVLQSLLWWWKMETEQAGSHPHLQQS